MTEILVIGFAAGIILAVLASAGGMVRWQTRRFDRAEQAWLRERGELLDRLAHARGRTWTPPPLSAVGSGDSSPDLFEGIVSFPEQALPDEMVGTE